MGQGRGGVQQAFASRVDASDSRQRRGRGPWRQLDRPVAPPAAPRPEHRGWRAHRNATLPPLAFRAARATPGPTGVCREQKDRVSQSGRDRVACDRRLSASLTGGDTTARPAATAARAPCCAAAQHKGLHRPAGQLAFPPLCGAPWCPPWLVQSWSHLQFDRPHASSTGSSVPWLLRPAGVGVLLHKLGQCADVLVRQPWAKRALAPGRAVLPKSVNQRMRGMQHVYGSHTPSQWMASPPAHSQVHTSLQPARCAGWPPLPPIPTLPCRTRAWRRAPSR